MKRRDILRLPGVAAILLARPALAQKETPLVAVLVPGTEKPANDRATAIRQGLREAGLAKASTTPSQPVTPMASSTACRGARGLARTARQLGIDVPPTFLADEVVE
jgi:hypothetical protein